MIRIMNKAHSSITIWGLRKIIIKKDAPILDIGCGGGQTIHMLAKQNSDSDIYGIDYAQKAVETTIQKNRKAVTTGRVRITQGEVSALPFDDELFGTITAVQTHYFWPDLKNDVKEVFRVLKNGGIFIIISEIYKIDYHMKMYTRNEDVEQLFQHSGFQTVDIHENNKWRCYIGVK